MSNKNVKWYPKIYNLQKFLSKHLFLLPIQMFLLLIFYIFQFFDSVRVEAINTIHNLVFLYLNLMKRSVI